MTTMGGDVQVRTAAQLSALASQLRAFNGHRTIWIDLRSGTIVHTEPEIELEADGHRYVATVLSPSADELAHVLACRQASAAA